MEPQCIMMGDIPAYVWGTPSDRVYLFIHGRQGSGMDARRFAEIAAEKGFQTVSIDLPQHGARRDSAKQCDVFDAVPDLRTAYDYIRKRWQYVGLFGCSIGAHFALYAFPDVYFENCLFQSPVTDMPHLIEKMFLWFGITREQLEMQVEIPTPVDTMKWKWYCFAQNHAVEKWDSPTHILRGGRDELQSEAVIRAFAERFGCDVTCARESGHAFMEPQDDEIVRRWMQTCIE